MCKTRYVVWPKKLATIELTFEKVDRLEDVFRKVYGFNVQQQHIKSKSTAQLQMFRHLAEFTLEHGKEHALLIVYYAGHGWHSSEPHRTIPGSFDLHP